MTNDYISKMVEETIEGSGDLESAPVLTFQEKMSAYSLFFHGKVLEIPMTWSVMSLLDRNNPHQVISSESDSEHFFEILSVFYDRKIDAMELNLSQANVFSVSFLSNNELKIAA